MKKILTICLAAMLLLTLCACGEDETSTTTPTTAPSTNPTTSSTTKPQAMTEDDAKKIAAELLGNYIWYGAVGSVCEMEYVDADMTQYLSDAQKDLYIGSQQRITCCHNADEVHAHIESMIARPLIENYPDDLLFTDNDGNLYIIIYPTGFSSYRNHRVIFFDETTIVVEADCVEADEIEGKAKVTCIKGTNGFLLSEFVFTPIK